MSTAKKSHKIMKIVLLSFLSVCIITLIVLFIYTYTHAINDDPTINMDFHERQSTFEANLENDTYYSNNLDSRLPVTTFYNVMFNHFNNNSSGKTPKLLFMGFDGCVADGFQLRENETDSAFFELLKTGTAVLAYTGGENLKGQYVKTGPGWTSIFTGQWGSKTNVTDNFCILNPMVKTIQYTLANEGYKVSFNNSWYNHNYIVFSCEHFFSVLKRMPLSYTFNDNDEETHDAMIASLDRDDDALFCIYEYTDHAGHGSEYDVQYEKYADAVKTADQKAYELIQKVYERPTYETEDWLIIITTDHGGINSDHIGHTDMEATTFWCSNKPLPGYSNIYS